MAPAFLGALLLAVSTPAGFTDNLPAALERAKAEQKSVLMVCSGSDWCGWCKRLEREVLSDAAFLPLVKDRYELVFIDMPQDKSLLSDWGREHNEQVCIDYGIMGFPTCLIVDADGKVVSRFGYQEGGAAKFAETLDYLKVNQADIDKYIEPYRTKINNLVAKMNKTFKSGRNGPRKMLLKYTPQVAKLAAEIEALEVPEAIAGEKAELIEFIRGMREALDELKESLGKEEK